MNKKAEMFNELLEKGPEGVFNIEETKDELNSVIYQSRLTVNEKNLYFLIVFDDTDTTSISFMLDDENVTSENYGYVVDFCNEQNRTNRIMRFYVDNDDRVMMDCCVVAKEEMFDPAVVATLVDAMAETVARVTDDLQKAFRCEE